jgi:AcrR family transcriptional regulator
VRERDIVAAARRIFCERGYDRASVAEIAEDVGVVEGTVYTYFGTKRALLHRVIAEFYDPLITDVERSITGIAGARNQIRFIIWRQLRAFVEEPELCYLVIRELQPTANSYDSVVVGLARRYTAMAVRAVALGIAAGEIRPEISPLLIRAVIYGSVENVAWRLLYRRQPIDVDRIADELTDILCAGIAQTPDRKDTSDTSATMKALVDEFRELVAQARPEAARTKHREN